jgi:hypothetical protein
MAHPGRTLMPIFDVKSRPEHIVGLGFRCSLTCLRAVDGDTSQQACALLSAAIEAETLPQAILADFTAWTLAVEASAGRPIVVLPIDSLGFGRDECLAISLVAACQHGRCPALTACAFALLGRGDIARALVATRMLSASLLAAGTCLVSDAIAEVAGFAPALRQPGSGTVH